MDEIVNGEIERRTIPITELRAVEQDNGRMLVGYAAVFNTLSEVMASREAGSFREQIAPGAFTRSLASQPDVKALFNHDPNQIIGRSTSGTLALAEDDRGLRVEIDLPDTTLGRDLHTLVQRGDISQMSFSFRVRQPNGERWERGIRTLVDVDLFDVSPVTDSAYKATVVSARALQRAQDACSDEVVVNDDETNGQGPVAIDDQQDGELQGRLAALVEALNIRQRRFF